MRFEIDANFAGLKDLEQALKLVPGGFEKSTVRALNKTVVGIRTDMVAMLRRDYNFKAGAIRNLIGIRRAVPESLEAWVYGLWFRGSGMPLLSFRRGARSVPSTRRLKSGGYSPKIGISVRVKKGGGNKKVKGAFVARMGSGHIGVFRRKPGTWMTTDDSYGEQIEELYGPSPLKLLESDRYDDEISDKLIERWDKNIQHEGEFILKKAGLMA